MSVLKFKDPVTNEWKGITTIKGDPGEPGYTPIKGIDYFDGEPGYTPIKGVDYFDGEPGQPGEPGSDYVLTDEDKMDIAVLALSMMPTAEEGEY